jgi:hypothetical protein
LCSFPASPHYRRNNFPNHSMNDPPSVSCENHYRDFPLLQILLIGDIVVGGHQHVKTGILGGSEKVAIRQGRPTLLPCCPDGVFRKKTSDCDRRALIKENAHVLRKR